MVLPGKFKSNPTIESNPTEEGPWFHSGLEPRGENKNTVTYITIFYGVIRASIADKKDGEIQKIELNTKKEALGSISSSWTLQHGPSYCHANPVKYLGDWYVIY